MVLMFILVVSNMSIFTLYERRMFGRKVSCGLQHLNSYHQFAGGCLSNFNEILVCCFSLFDKNLIYSVANEIINGF